MNPDPQRVEELFDQAMQYKTEERPVFLAGACGNDVNLRKRVEDLLMASESRSGFLPGNSSHELAFLDESPLTEETGTIIGRFKLLEKLGEGGFGSVWAAEQKEPIRRRVALKIIKLGMDTKNVVSRFEAERQALALMDHPNIAKVLDAGATDTGRPYFVMELVKGIAITKYCEQQKLSTKARLDLFIKVCHAIQHAHQKGIIHRDIKPSNVMVTLHDGAPVPKVIDFGIAKATHRELTEKTIYTQYNQFIGTPAYMSPEQAELSGLDIDTRSDIYSLGVLLYELLTGTTPFDTKELIQSGLDEMRKIIRERDPMRPSTRLRKTLTDSPSSSSTAVPRPSSLPTDLDWIVMKALEKDRTRRCDTANALAMDLKRHFDNEPVVARPPSAAYKFYKAWRRNIVACTAGAVVVAALVVGLSVSVWQVSVAIAARAEEEVQRKAAEAARADEAQLRLQAQEQERLARHRAYAADMNLAQRAVELNDIGEAKRILDRYRLAEGAADMRGWEWRYLWQFCRSDTLFHLTQLPDAIRQLSVSSDGRWLVAGPLSLYGHVEYWDLAARRPAPFPWGDLRIGSAAFSPVEPLIAVSYQKDDQSFVRLIDPISKDVHRELGPFQGVPARPRLAFSPDGKVVAILSLGATSNIRQLDLWGVQTGELIAKHRLPTTTPYLRFSFALAPDLKALAYTEGWTGSIRVIESVSGELKWEKKVTDEVVIVVAFSPDSRLLVTGAGFAESTIRVWDVETGAEVGSLEGQRGYTIDLTFLENGTLVSGCSDQTIRFWNLETLQPAGILKGQLAEVTRLAVLPDKRTLISSGQDGRVMAWDHTTKSRKGSVTTLPLYGSEWRFTSDSDAILAVDLEHRLIRRAGEDFDKIEIVHQLKKSVTNWKFSEDGGHFAAAGPDGEIDVLNIGESPIKHWTLKSRDSVKIQAVLPEGNTLLVIQNPDNELQKWDMKTGVVGRRWKLGNNQHSWAIGILAISPDGAFAVLCDGVGHRILDLRTGIFLEQGFDDFHFGGSFSPDGRYFAFGSGSHAARFLNFPEMTEAFQLRGHQIGAKSACFTADMSRVFTSSAGKQALIVWDH